MAMSSGPAIGIVPGRQGFVMTSREAEPAGPRDVCCDVEAVGCCVTDVLVMNGLYGKAPPGRNDLVIGHEVVVRAAESTDAIAAGQVFVLKVREAAPDAPPFARRRPDLCDGHYVERGLWALDGGMRSRLVASVDSMVPVPSEVGPLGGVFLEPAACVVKALRVMEACRRAVAGDDEEIVARRALVLGAGTCGLLAAARLRFDGYAVTVLDLVSATSVRARLARLVGAEYRENPTLDVAFPGRLVAEGGPHRFVFDTTGNPAEVARFEAVLGPTGVAVDFGIPHTPCVQQSDLAVGTVRRVLGNRVRVGSVNAGPEDWDGARRLVTSLVQRCPAFVPSALRSVSGLDIPAMVDALHDRAVVKTVVCPNGPPA